MHAGAFQAAAAFAQLISADGDEQRQASEANTSLSLSLCVCVQQEQRAAKLVRRR